MTTLPPAFREQMRSLLHDEAEDFFSSLDRPVITSVRKNPVKPGSSFANEKAIPWSTNGYYLQERPSFIADPLHHAGAYYVQESSSQFLSYVLESIRDRLPDSPRMLDLCAAPGGKSTLISAFLGEKGLLVTNEIIQSRVKILAENMTKWGAPNVIVTNNDPKSFGKLKHYFDVIVTDAPCSGEGMFRKDKKAIDEWSPEHIEHCASRQQRILGDVISSLKPGGFLVYATCTFNTQENEANVRWMTNEFGLIPVPVDIPESWNIRSPEISDDIPAFRFFPHHTDGEGLFICCLRKGNETATDTLKFHGVKPSFPSRQEQGMLRTWLKPETQTDFFFEGNRVIALPEHLMSDCFLLKKYLYIIQAGTLMGEMIKGQLIPDHALALSTMLNDEVQQQELTLEQAHRYLRKDTLPADIFTAAGWTLVTFKGQGLGWVKVLPNRVNNYLPTHLRILKEL